MQSKLKAESINKVNNEILNVIRDKKATVLSSLRSSFYFTGRKSEAIAKEIIESLTEEGDIILDPFFGGGSFILSSLLANRFVEGIELDNYTYDVFTMLLTKMDKKIIQDYFNIIKSNIKNEVMNLYITECCGEKNYIQKLLYDLEDDEYYNPNSNREIVDGRNVILINKCPVCKNKSKKFSDYDKQVLLKSQKLDNSGFPTDSLIENSRINITKSIGADKYDIYFTERNKHALLLIQKEISALPDTIEKKLIQHALVSSLALSKIAMYGSSTDNLYHLNGTNTQDMNVWYLFESKFKSILKFKEQFKLYLVDDIKSNKLMRLHNSSYDDALAGIADKYDLIYTDFPYTDQVPFLERNQLYRKWLEIFCDSDRFKLTNEMLKKEIVITNAPSRKDKHDIENYYFDLDKMMGIFYKVLKDDKYMVFTMNLGTKKYIRTYTEIINLARKNGFEYVTRVGIEKNDPTLRKQSAYANTIMNEVIVVFKKLPAKNRYWYEGKYNYEYIATKLVYDHILRQKGKTSTLTTAVQLIRNDLLSKGIDCSKSKDDLAKKVINENFTVDNGFIYIDGNKLYLDIEDNTTLFVKLYDLIPLYIKKLLDKKGRFVLEDLYLELTNSLCNNNSNTFSQLLEDTNYQKQITMLIDNYCELCNGYYIEKQIDNTASEDREDISQYTGTKFEELIKELLSKEGFFDIIVIGGAGDRGVDILASIMIDKEVKKYIFQCKRWISNVGSEPIQRLFAEREYHKFDKAICITTSDYTSEGKDALKRFNVEGLNGWDVQKNLNKHFPNQYFNRALNIAE